MPSPRKILLIDYHADNRALLSRTLLRKFPKAVVAECTQLGTAIEAAGTEHFDCVVLHRSNDADAVSLLRSLRAVNAGIAIVVMSGGDRREEMLAAGANNFLRFDEWLRVGSVIEATLKSAAATRESPGQVGGAR